ncbi:hypothetical protein AU184_19400 [Mycolicibacterium novocastrense]|nr:hypothetical protein AU184_19400 [Mycolicibacterium novocastrense]KUH71340.1 hypothetical protein AU183_06030 [Mycolicibacterium novocastrense]KUH74404.1 hypothetical protein AU072_17445 [Mycolicibacterium novocastrense]
MVNFSGISEFPLYHNGDIGSLSVLDDSVDVHLIVVDVNPAELLADHESTISGAVRLSTVWIVPPDGDGHNGYCDLDMAYSCYLADHQCVAMAVRHDGKVLGAISELSKLSDLVARVVHKGNAALRG